MRNQCSRLCFRLTFSKTIEKKKCLFRNMSMSLTLTLRWWHWHSGLVLTSTTQCGTIGPDEGFHYWDQDRTPSSCPHIYCTASWISMLAPNSRVFTEGSRLTTYSWSETYIFLNFSMVSIWDPINTLLEWQNNATKCITNTKLINHATWKNWKISEQIIRIKMKT